MKNYLLLIIVFVSILASCRKDKNEKPACRINRLINPAGKIIKITFDADGNYSKIENAVTNRTTSVAYDGNTIVSRIVNASTGMPLQTSTVVLNISGMVNTQKNEYYSYNGAQINSVLKNEYEYNGMQPVKIEVIDSFFSGPTISTFSVDYLWEEGNMVLAAAPSYLARYEYYTDTPFRQGDVQSVQYLLWGFDMKLFKNNKNLTKTDLGKPYTYEFDAEGKIKTILSNGDVVYFVEYECN